MSLLKQRLKAHIDQNTVLFNITWLHLQPNSCTWCPTVRGLERFWHVDYSNSSSRQEEDEQISHSQHVLKAQDLQTPPKVNRRFQQATQILSVWWWLATRHHHHLCPPVGTCYALKAEAELYSERFLTLFNTFPDNPGVTAANFGSRLADDPIPQSTVEQICECSKLRFQQANGDVDMETRKADLHLQPVWDLAIAPWLTPLLYHIWRRILSLAFSRRYRVSKSREQMPSVK